MLRADISGVGHLNVGRYNMVEFIDETSEREGTPINRANLMALQGFVGMTTEKLPNGDILQTNSAGQTLLTHKEGGVITQTFTGEKVITKTITKSDGKIVEVIS